MKYFLILLISIYINTIFSQNNSIGVKVAPSISFFDYKIFNFDTKSTNLTYSLGLQYQRKLSTHFSLIGELCFDYRRHTQGVFISTTSNPIGYEEELSTVFQYIDIPILLRYRFTKNPSIYVNVGISNSIKLTSYQVSATIPKNNDIQQYTTIDNLGLLAGIGLAQKISKDLTISFETRYRYGLNNHMSVNNVSVNGNVLYGICGLNFNF